MFLVDDKLLEIDIDRLFIQEIDNKIIFRAASGGGRVQNITFNVIHFHLILVSCSVVFWSILSITGNKNARKQKM